MPSVMGTKEFLDFQQTIRDLERQVDILLREAATNGPSQRTRELTEKVYILAERAKQIRLPEARNQSTTNQSILEKLPKQFDEDFGKFKGLTPFVEWVRKQHYNATGHNLGRTYGSFGTKEISPGHHHGKLTMDTLEIRCDACGNESLNRKEETTQFTSFFTTMGNGKFVPVNPTVNAKATRARAFELASTYLPKD